MSVVEAALPEQRFYDVREVAAIFRSSRMTVYRAIGAGQMPAVRMLGRWLVPKKFVDDLIEKAMTDGTQVLSFLTKNEGR